MTRPESRPRLLDRFDGLLRSADAPDLQIAETKASTAVTTTMIPNTIRKATQRQKPRYRAASARKKKKKKVE